MRTKGIWPTASRDALIMSFTDALPDGRLINVTTSIPAHPLYTPRPSDVRMLAKIAGLVIGPHPSGDPRRCRCVQIVDGDLGGWLPASVVSMVTTQAFPISMRRANAALAKVVVHRTTSQLIEFAKGRAVVVVTEAGGVDVKKAGVESKVVRFLKVFHKCQPWMVLAILLILIRNRHRA